MRRGARTKAAPSAGRVTRPASGLASCLNTPQFRDLKIHFGQENRNMKGVRTPNMDNQSSQQGERGAQEGEGGTGKKLEPQRNRRKRTHTATFSKGRETEPNS